MNKIIIAIIVIIILIIGFSFSKPENKIIKKQLTGQVIYINNNQITTRDIITVTFANCKSFCKNIFAIFSKKYLHFIIK